MDLRKQQLTFYTLLLLATLATMGWGFSTAGMQGAAFGFFASFTIGGGLMCIWERSVVRSAFSLMATFCGVAGLFILLGHDFLAMAQILIYVGGILVLILFGVMLTPPDLNERQLPRVGLGVFAVVGALLFVGAKVAAVVNWAQAETLAAPRDQGRGDRRRLPARRRLRRRLRARGRAAHGGARRGRLHRAAQAQRLHRPRRGGGLLMGLEAYVVVATLLFGLGVACLITRRNVIYVLMGIEMILNSANINFVAFNRFNGDGMDGRMFAIFVIILAAAEAAVALGIVLNVFQLFGTVKPSDVDLLRE